MSLEIVYQFVSLFDPRLPPDEWLNGEKLKFVKEYSLNELQKNIERIQGEAAKAARRFCEEGFEEGGS